MELVNFKVSDQYITLSILDILLTERYQQDLTQIPSEDLSFLGIKDYVGTPTPVFNMGVIMTGVSTQQTNDNLAKALSDQQEKLQQWFNDLSAAIENQRPFTIAHDAKQTEFAHWYRHHHTEDEDLKNLLSRLQEPYEKLYLLAHELLLLVNNHQQDKATTLLKSEAGNLLAYILRLIEAAKEQVVQSYKPIIVYTTLDGRSPYIGLLVDSVEDSVNVPDNTIKSLEQVKEAGFQLDDRTKKMLRGIVKLDNIYSLLINPREIFQSEPIDLAS